MDSKLYDVYIWPISNASRVQLVAKGVDHETAMKYYSHYFETNIYDAYIVPNGTKIFM